MSTTRCTHRTLKPYFASGEVDFNSCCECGLVMRVPMPTAAELDAIYDSLYGEDSIAHGKTSQESGDYALEQYAGYLTRHVLTPGCRVLDHGCGSGHLVELLRRRGFVVEGAEASEGARKFCREHRGIELHESVDGFAERSFDFITMIEVIEHLTDPHGVLVALLRLLRPGGRLFVTTPNRRGLRARLDGGNWREARKKFHVVLFDERSLRATLRLAGFASLTRVRFPPVQRPDHVRRMVMRAQQLLNLGGTLCFQAARPSGAVSGPGI